MKAKNPHVLVVDDEEDLSELLQLRLRHEGFMASTCTNSRGALAILESQRIDAMLLDLRLEDEDGLDLLSQVLDRYGDLPVIMLTAHGTTDLAVEAMKRGAYGFITKPFDDHELIQELRHAVDHAHLRREVAGLRRMVGRSGSQRLLGTSEPISDVREIIARAASTDATVLILGESGTGKELAARSIHDLSPRHAAPFVAINCGALPGDLLESELFGHVRGAFTGAAREKEGLFAAAHGGTLFLDEIGDAPADVQVKLLRVLQERQFVPVGATEPRATDVRIVAATNRDLAESVREGSFREDLYYRLHVVPVRMPPLRARAADIPVLAQVFLARSGENYRLSDPQFSKGAIEFLLKHDWPGNVRELANVVEAAAVLSRDGTITVEHLEAVLPRSVRPRSLEGDTSFRTHAPFAGGTPFESLRQAKVKFEREYLVSLMKHCKGNVSAASRIAERNRSDFHELLKRHGVQSADYRDSEEAVDVSLASQN